LFIAACLENLNIPYNYKYVSFSPVNKDVTHVYIEAFPSGKLTFMDVPLRKFNQQKTPFYNHILISNKQMSEIHSVGNIGFSVGEPYNKVIDFGTKDIGEISEGEADLWIAKDRLQTERDIVAGIGAIGKAEKYNDAIDVINDALGSIGRVPDNELEREFEYIAYQSALGRYANAPVIGSIGSAQEKYDFRLGAMQQRANERAKWRAAGLVVPAEIGKTKLGKFLKNTAKKVNTATQRVYKKAATVTKAVAKTTVKVAKTAVKAATFVPRLIIKGILEVSLPKAAPFFLYLFLTDAQAKTAPSKVQAKRKKATNIANFIVNGIGMKRNHFMEICRNGIMKQSKKSPEALIAEQMKTKKTVAGVGFVITAATITVVMGIIEAVQKLTKKKSGDKLTASDTPTAEDWQGTTTAAEKTIKTGLAKSTTSDFVKSDSDTATTSENATSSDTFTSNTKKATGICG
jgi:hypothetical protein